MPLVGTPRVAGVARPEVIHAVAVPAGMRVSPAVQVAPDMNGLRAAVLTPGLLETSDPLTVQSDLLRRAR